MKNAQFKVLLSCKIMTFSEKLKKLDYSINIIFYIKKVENIFI